MQNKLQMQIRSRELTKDNWFEKVISPSANAKHTSGSLWEEAYFFQYSQSFGEESKYLIGISDVIILAEPYGGWTEIELLNAYKQGKEVICLCHVDEYSLKHANPGANNPWEIRLRAVVHAIDKKLDNLSNRGWHQDEFLDSRVTHIKRTLTTPDGGRFSYNCYKNPSDVVEASKNVSMQVQQKQQ